MRNRRCPAAALLGCLAALPTAAALLADEPILNRTLLVKAQPDECYYGIGNPSNTYPWDPLTPCDGRPKVNSAYPWGMTMAGDDIWIGTGENTYCILRGLAGSVADPFETPSLVCEFGDSIYNPYLVPEMRDWRAPHIFVYDTVLKTLTDKVPLLDSPALSLLNSMSGVRAAGASDGVVLLGGQSFFGGINLFAFNSDTGEFLGSDHTLTWRNVRSMIVVDGVMYIGVKNGDGSGSVLRWNGDAQNPFDFEIVATLDSQVASFAEYAGRLFASTWPEYPSDNPKECAIYHSPPIPPGGLTSQHIDHWTKVWKASDYEPDPFVKYFYAGGAMAAYGDYLFFGTMHSAGGVEIPDPNEAGGAPRHAQRNRRGRGTATNLYRPITVYRGHFTLQPRDTRKPIGGFEYELLYGDLNILVYDPDLDRYILKPNNLGIAGSLGPSGINSRSNSYTWTMGVFGGQLYLGTLDFSYMTDSTPPPPGDPPNPNWGGDLLRFPTPDSAALVESADGLGNYSSYGVRQLLVRPDAIYAGMANPANLLTDLTDDVPEGGWELWKLTLP